MNEYYSISKINKNNDYSKLKSEDQKRIKLLRVPPNWNMVKVSKDLSSKVQVTGIDARGRTQYIYHPIWTLFSKDVKYSKVNSIDFNKFNFIINKFSNKELSNNFSKNYIISNMFILMRDLNIRVGNEKYFEENNSVGLCTLQKIHYIKQKNKNSDDIIHKFIFKGKKGIIHEKTLKIEHINFIENIIKIPGKSLFKYYDIKNQFLKDNIDKNMSCKDIRTYCANEIFRKEYSRLLNSGISPKKSRIEATKLTACELGNTPKVCRDSYIDPTIYIE